MSYLGIHNPLRSRAASYGALLVFSASAALAQMQPPPPPADPVPHAWRKADPPPAPAVDPAPAPEPEPQVAEQAPAQANPAPPPPNYSSFPSFPTAPQQSQLPNPNTPLPGGSQRPYAGQDAQAPYAVQGAARQVPAQLTMRPGTTVTVRLSQAVSSEHNRAGDTYYATLAEPLIVDGVVVAHRGETVTGRVTEAQKASSQGASKLGLELVGLKLADGTPVTVQSQMIDQSGHTPYGNQAGVVVGTTAVGAAIGAGAAGGSGAAIGAGAGVVAGLIGSLFTKGSPTVLYPETPLTFSLKAPVEISTERAPQAFRYATNRDYGAGAPAYAQRPVPPPPPVYYGPAYYLYPNYWGPSVYVGGYYRGFRRW